MKKTVALFAILLTVLLLVGCTSRTRQNSGSADVTGVLIGWYDDTFEIRKSDGSIVKVQNSFANEGMPIYRVEGSNKLVSYTGDKKDLIGKQVYISAKSESGSRTRVSQLAARLK